MKLIRIILEEKEPKPKAVVMAGGAGAGKSHLLRKLDLNSLPSFNPDTYVEDPSSTMYNNLAQASVQVGKDVEKASDAGESFVWDTTASNPQKVKDLLSKGYDVFMIMVYTHPMISFISNFSRERRIPKSAVFTTWKNVYSLIDDYQRLLGENFKLFVNLRDSKYDTEIEGFNKAAKRGVNGVVDYLTSYMESHGGVESFSSTFRSEFKLSGKELAEFNEDMRGIKYDNTNNSLVKYLQKYWFSFYEKKGEGPGREKMENKLKSILLNIEKQKRGEKEVLEDIANMITNQNFQSLLQHSSVDTIKRDLQKFL